MRKRLTDWWGRVRCWTDRHADPDGDYTAIKLVRGTAYYGSCPRCGAVLVSDDTHRWYRSVMFTDRDDLWRMQ